MKAISMINTNIPKSVQPSQEDMEEALRIEDNPVAMRIKIMGPSVMEGPTLYTIGFPVFDSVVSRGKGSH